MRTSAPAVAPGAGQRTLLNDLIRAQQQRLRDRQLSFAKTPSDAK